MPFREVERARPSKHAAPEDGRTPLNTRERSEEHTSELQSPCNLVCRLLLEKKKKDLLHTRSPICSARCYFRTPSTRVEFSAAYARLVTIDPYALTDNYLSRIDAVAVDIGSKA